MGHSSAAGRWRAVLDRPLASNVRFVFLLLAAAQLGAVVIIAAEAWRVRDRSRELQASSTLTAEASALAVGTTVYSQSVRRYIESPTAADRQRVTDAARALDWRVAALLDTTRDTEAREWSGHTRVAHARLREHGDDLVAAVDRQREARGPDDAAAQPWEIGPALTDSWGRLAELRNDLHATLAVPLQADLPSRARRAAGEVDASVGTLSAAVVLLLAVALLAGVGAAVLLRARILRPLRDLAEGAAAIGAGDLDHTIHPPADGDLGQVAVAFNEMTARLREHHGALEDQIAERTREIIYLAKHDALTGLVNRAGFHQALADALKSANRRGEGLAVLLLDLDGFKAVNDTLGHEQGDELLRVVAQRLRSQCRQVDSVARLGGDEFCILLTAIHDIHSTADVAERCLATLLAPVELQGRPVTPRASIGIAMYPEDARDAGGLLRAADTAMYAAKQAGRQCYQFYDPRMTRDVEEQTALEAELRAAIENGAFELHYQPKVSLGSGRLIGVEALIRWPRRGHGFVAPDAFIPTVERLGLIGSLGDWVLRTACEQACAWRRAGLPAFDIAVNVSPTHFAESGFVEGVEHVLAATGLDPRALEIELTESVMRDTPLVGDTCRRLRRMGVRIAIDDFGAGFSSLTSLKHTSIDTLKIDRQFVQGLLDDTEAPLLLGTVLGMAAGLRLTTVAEGVETLQEVQVLQSLGCHAAQGFYFSAPVPPESIPALARAAYFVRAAAG